MKLDIKSIAVMLVVGMVAAFIYGKFVEPMIEKA